MDGQRTDTRGSEGSQRGEKAEKGQRKRRTRNRGRKLERTRRKGARPWGQVPGALSKPAESSPMKGPKKKKGGWKCRSVSCKGTEPSEELSCP